ncbi:hypothetical protein PRUB_b0957 [Pseudoalteromonas rubra]|uniref:Uncharacterized protein n=1 Tax=Pseudoalteromonas rubra TaxID=43658 RepID=A0A8T0C326_9GAMM|nr:hypothetical protein [Pseudoalteromonas rubra]KAF7781658.1 hypothetical protein PRUB_b0957 [Pseudoalteromonas rubra]
MKTMNISAVVAGMLAFLSLGAQATVTSGGYYKIDKLYTWADYTDNVFLITLESQSASAQENCPFGYWLDKSSTTNGNVFSAALAAYHANTKVLIYADETADWSGLRSKECKIKSIISE